MQTEIVNLNDLVKKDHPYRKLLSIIDFSRLAKNITHIKNNQVVGRAGYGVDACLKMLVLQFMEDLSDRELERFIAENTAAKLFCDFSLISQTPDHSLFSRLVTPANVSDAKAKNLSPRLCEPSLGVAIQIIAKQLSIKT